MATKEFHIRQGFFEETIKTQGVMVCAFLEREIKTLRDVVQKKVHTFEDECGRTVTLRPEGMASDQRLLDSAIDIYNWVADITENGDLRRRINIPTRSYTVALSEDEYTSLCNLLVTLRENMDKLRQVTDFSSEDSTVAEMVESSLDGYEALMRQLF